MWGEGVFFPTNLDLASILDMMDVGFKTFNDLDLKLRLEPAASLVDDQKPSGYPLGFDLGKLGFQ